MLIEFIAAKENSDARSVYIDHTKIVAIEEIYDEQVECLLTRIWYQLGESEYRIDCKEDFGDVCRQYDDACDAAEPVRSLELF